MRFHTKWVIEYERTIKIGINRMTQPASQTSKAKLINVNVNLMI